MHFWLGTILILLGAFSSLSWVTHHNVIPVDDANLHHLISFVFVVAGLGSIYKYKKQNITRKGWESVGDDDTGC